MYYFTNARFNKVLFLIVVKVLQHRLMYFCYLMMISFNAPNKLDVFFPILDVFLAIIFTGVVYLGDILHHDLPAAKHLSKKSRGRRV